jgi:hypothetical protein
VICGFPISEEPDDLTVLVDDSIPICLECFLSKTELKNYLKEEKIPELRKWIRQIQRKKEKKLLKGVTA